MTDTPTISTTQNSDNVPWYLKKADRPKDNCTVRLHVEDTAFLNDKNIIAKDMKSAFVRFLFDCFRAEVIPTISGFNAYIANGEKPLDDKQKF